MSGFSITKQQTNLLKGSGILLIVLHNYFHWIPPFTGENEFIFNANFTNNTIQGLLNNFSEIPNILFSFFGHYGVQLFIFISGYGLAKSFSKSEKGYLQFLKQRGSKIYPAFVIGIIVLVLYTLVVYATIPSFSWFAKIGLKLAMVHTLIPRQALSINGPWWFYGLIFQLYIIFIPLLVILKKWRWKGFLAVIAISYSIVFLTYKPLLNEDVYIMANAPGHIPEFALGVLLAIVADFRIRLWHILCAILLFIIGNFYFMFFPFTFIAIAYLLILTIVTLFKTQSYLSKFIQFYGELSMFLFAIHAFFRKPYFVDTALATSSATEKLAIGMLYLLTVTIVSFICKELYTRASIAIATRK
jgi:peptidoglycan/LPS O-acetylase OafA/YrhL